MYLFFLREAQTEDFSVLYPDDYARPLTSEGYRWTQRAAQRIDQLVGRFDLILCSSLPRIRLTAEVVAEACGYRRPPEVNDWLNGRFEGDIIARNIREIGNYESVLIVAQSPVLDQLITYHVSGHGNGEIRMHTGSLGCIEMQDLGPGRAILHWLIPGAILGAETSVESENPHDRDDATDPHYPEQTGA